MRVRPDFTRRYLLRSRGNDDGDDDDDDDGRKGKKDNRNYISKPLERFVTVDASIHPQCAPISSSKLLEQVGTRHVGYMIRNHGR